MRGKASSNSAALVAGVLSPSSHCHVIPGARFAGGQAGFDFSTLFRMTWHLDFKDSLAEWSKALAQGASPQGHGLEPHSCHFCKVAVKKQLKPAGLNLSCQSRLSEPLQPSLTFDGTKESRSTVLRRSGCLTDEVLTICQSAN